jgi:cytochrome c556
LARDKFTLDVVRRIAVVGVASVCAAFIARGQTPPQRRSPPISLTGNPQRARPPVWSIDVLDAFFPDARIALVGPRPDYGRGAGDERQRAPSLSAGGAPEARPQPPGAKWSSFVDAETIETEIKRLAQAVAADVTKPGPFKGGGFQAARRHFSQLAALFAVISEFDGPIRWQDIAPGLRESFARAGRNAKVGSDQTYAEAVARKQDLEELVRGARPQVPAAEKTAKWGEVADRPPLMQRLNVASQERLAKWLASETEFSRRADEIRHESQIIAMLAQIVSREGFDYWDDTEYAAYARELHTAAQEVINATELNNYDEARRALDRASKACADCHEGYRG